MLGMAHMVFWAALLGGILWACSVVICILRRGSSPEVGLFLFLGSTWEEREDLCWLQQLVHRALGCRVLFCCSGLPAAPSAATDASSLLCFSLCSQEPMGELMPFLIQHCPGLSSLLQHDAKLSICKYTFNYKPPVVRSIPWETVESV